MMLRTVSENHKYTSVFAADDAGPGGASHCYRIIKKSSVGLKQDNPFNEFVPILDINFQKGPIKESGINGVMDENLLEIVADRLRGFQSGLFHCRENAIALTKVEEALLWLGKRTAEREARGVEGTSIQ